MDGGYENFRHWHSEGWDWVRQNNIECPLYWHQRDGEWFQFTLGGLRKLRFAMYPVCHVSFYEAAAFAEWKGSACRPSLNGKRRAKTLIGGCDGNGRIARICRIRTLRRPQGAVGEYNGKFMINQMVLRGATIRDPGRTQSQTPIVISFTRIFDGNSPESDWLNRLTGAEIHNA